MPSKDPISESANAWMREEGAQGRRLETAAQAPTRSGSRTVRSALSAAVLRLARRRGTSPEALAASIPEDTLLRLKNPVIEQETETGILYKHPLGIVEGRRASIR